MSLYRTEIARHFNRADKARNDYAYLTFRLPCAARRLQVAYHYSASMSSDRTEGGNVVDIGLFDPHGAEFPGGIGFRGWSGSARQEFFITPTDATPGYLPGPLPAGQYTVVLGLYRVWEQGVDVTVTIEAELDPALTDAGPVPVALPPQTPQDDAARATFWLRGDLQSHTHHSDAHCTVHELLAQAARAGLDFLAITDHNTVSHHPALEAAHDAGLILLRGQECTTYYGHMNIWGTSRWCDFRARTDAEMRRIIDLAHASGALCSINHPKSGGPAWEFSTELPVDAMEVWQGPWAHRNHESLALWDGLLRAGRRLPLVGGSDYHCRHDTPSYLRVGQPTTWVQVHARRAEAILAALAAGRACVSYAPEGPRLEIRAETATAHAGMGETLHLEREETVSVTVRVEGGMGHALHIIADGEVVHASALVAPSTQIAIPIRGQQYVRAEIVGDPNPDALPADVPDHIDLREWRWALSNPVYLRRAHAG